LPWFSLKLCVTKVDNSDRSVWYRNFERGVRANPTFWSTYVAGADFHLPRWCGSIEDFVDFIERSVELSRVYAGRSIAARIIHSLLMNYGETVIDDIHTLDRGYIKAGYQDWLNLYPRLSVMHALLLACRCFEKASAQLLRDSNPSSRTKAYVPVAQGFFPRL
jgi:hypothetical protein